MLADPQTQYWIIVAFSTLSALFWLISALSAYMNYRGFKQSQDLGWTVAFALFLLVHAGYAWIAYRLIAEWDVLPSASQQAADLGGFYQVNLSALDAFATMIFFYFFRARRTSF